MINVYNVLTSHQNKPGGSFIPGTIHSLKPGPGGLMNYPGL